MGARPRWGIEAKDLTVYVDDKRTHMKYSGYFGRWSGVWADTTEELHELAGLIGLADKKGNAKLLNAGTAYEHFLVTDKKRIEALEHGAVEMRFCGGLMYRLIERKFKDTTGKWNKP